MLVEAATNTNSWIIDRQVPKQAELFLSVDFNFADYLMNCEKFRCKHRTNVCPVERERSEGGR